MSHSILLKSWTFHGILLSNKALSRWSIKEDYFISLSMCMHKGWLPNIVELPFSLWDLESKPLLPWVLASSMCQTIAIFSPKNVCVQLQFMSQYPIFYSKHPMWQCPPSDQKLPLKAISSCHWLGIPPTNHWLHSTHLDAILSRICHYLYLMFQERNNPDCFGQAQSGDHRTANTQSKSKEWL